MPSFIVHNVTQRHTPLLAVIFDSISVLHYIISYRSNYIDIIELWEYPNGNNDLLKDQAKFAEKFKYFNLCKLLHASRIT